MLLKQMCCLKKTILIMILHHIIFDGFSIKILADQILSNYNYLTLGQANEPNKCSYLDLLKREEKYKNSERFKRDKEYWLKKLKENPFENINIQSSNIKGNRIVKNVPEFLLHKVDAFCIKNNISRYIFFLTVYALYVYKTESKDNIILGTISHNRTNKQEKQTMGVYVNTLPLFININKKEVFNELLNNIKIESGNVLKHQNYPFDLLMQDVRKEFNITSNLFNTIFSYENFQYPIKIEWHFNGYETFPLTIHFTERDPEVPLKAEFDYQLEQYTEGQIEFLFESMMKIAAEVLRNPEQHINEIEFLPEKGKNKILKDFNNTSCNLNYNQTLIEIFEEQVRKTPNASCLIYGDRKLTYKEFDERSGRLAELLKEKGLKKNKIAAICTGRSFEMFIGIYAILKAGGAYLPVSPSFPVDRISFIINDSDAQLVLVQDKFKEKIKNKLKLVVLEDPENYINEVKQLEAPCSPEDLCYVIYTSGTTGKPKGVKINHNSIVNRILWMQKEYPLTNKDTILHKTPFTFDVSVWEIFWWGFIGAKCLILETGKEKDPEWMLNSIKKNNITTMHFVPSMFNAFLEYIKTNEYDLADFPLKRIFNSGEELKSRYVEDFNKLFKDETMLYNLYGHTEASVDVTYYNCPIDSVPENIPIGKPISNIEIYILNKDRNLLPVGAPGELYISGIGVADGYLNRPELTDEKFVPNPFRNGEKMYRTGDLCKWLPDGNIEFLGRIDTQVKVRGYRIELGEIESYILQFTGVKEAACTVKTDKSDNKYICAYYVGDMVIDIDEIKEFLRKQLPEYIRTSNLF